MEEIYNSVVDLTSVIPTKSQDEIIQALDEHFFCKKTLLTENKADEIMNEVENLNSSSSSNVQSSSSSDASDDENIKKLLADLDA
jgi:ribosome-interacting GTPase 1